MSDISSLPTSMQKCIDLIEDVQKAVGGGRFRTSNDIGYDMSIAVEIFPRLIELLPFREGDRVCLNKNINCTGNWVYSKHFLVKGSQGTVNSIGFYHKNNDFHANVVFDDESWIDDKGVKHMIEDERKHTFYMRFEDLINLEMR